MAPAGSVSRMRRSTARKYVAPSTRSSRLGFPSAMSFQYSVALTSMNRASTARSQVSSLLRPWK